MGWTHTYKRRSTKAENFLTQPQYQPKNGEILKSKRRGNTVFQAVKMKIEDDYVYKTDEDGFFVACLIYEIRDIRDIEYNFGYKPTSESMGSDRTNCPKSVFNLLSDLRDDYIKLEWNFAHQWRLDVIKEYQNKAESRKLQKLPEDTMLSFPHDLNWTDSGKLLANTPIRLVIVPSRNRLIRAFEREDGKIVRIPKWTTSNPTIVSTPRGHR